MLTLRAIALAGLVLGLIVAGVVWLLLARRVDATQLDAVRTAGTLVVGAGGAVALLLAARRQRTAEQELQQKYAAADDAWLDATEKRITELYIKAAEQLGHTQAAVRLAGLYGLERLAQDTPRLRQTVVNVLCAYLRMPYTLPSPKLADDVNKDTQEAHEKQVQEREVRLTAQRILTKHLQPGPVPATPEETFWRSIDLDLDNATLVQWDLSYCQVHEATFNRAQFTAPTTFYQAQFTGPALFDRAQFTGPTMFKGAQFTRAWFGGARFEQGAPAEITAWPGPWQVRDDADDNAEPPSDNPANGHPEQ